MMLRWAAWPPTHLGWFDDPVLSTFINDTMMKPSARLILHELAHRQFYVSGDTTLQ